MSKFGDALYPEPGSLECWRCGEVYEPSGGPVTQCRGFGCSSKKLVPYGERFNPKHYPTLSPFYKQSRLEVCPCCGATDDDYKRGCCLRCGWRKGLPVVQKELPKDFDDDLDDWSDRAYPKDE